ncbi:Kef-type K+ transport system membrane component KefB [Saccharothrix ecbatanensis]|uniref:Kef-type K+ transport system membrane component KefB n=1 Tax=Saccharothrix ecbatanensis TaxID=1105145 RepID=A0A7W9HL10_9PSEU|nr:cation:proton antiporter [Saccharothrix ecbatanensis]MBB5803694.1 Kef-type K+ transport system membrane component KefB [Saccharothrix ecbatanensis]
MNQIHFALRVFAALAVVLAATTVCGRIAMLVKQPRVVGEMVAGVLLGPALLGAVAPGVQAQLFPSDVKDTLYVLSTIGLTFYMFLVGSSLDHGLTGGSNMRRASVLAVSGIVPTFILGAGAAALFFGSLSPEGSTRWEFMLFVGGALSITAFPMLARILQERGIANTPIGGLTLVAAAIDDAAAWVILAVVIAVAAAGSPFDALTTVAGAAVFAVLMLTVGRNLFARLGRRVEREGRVSRDMMAVILFVVLLAGWFTDYIGVFSVFGGFIVGLAMPQSAVVRRELETRLTDLNSILLLPVFFAFSGLNTQVSGFGAGGALWWPLAVIMAAAFAGKYLGCAAVVRAQGFPWRYASAVGGLMNARGLMVLIFINIGLAHGMVTPELFAILVAVAIVTTAAAMPIYRASLPDHVERTATAVAPAPPPVPTPNAP